MPGILRSGIPLANPAMYVHAVILRGASYRAYCSERVPTLRLAAAWVLNTGTGMCALDLRGRQPGGCSRAIDWRVDSLLGMANLTLAQTKVCTHRVLCDRHQAPGPGDPRRPRGHVLGSLRACTVGRCTLASALEPQNTDPLELSRAGGNAVTGRAAPHPVRWGTRQPAGGRRPRCYPHDPAHGVQVSPCRPRGNRGRPCPGG